MDARISPKDEVRVRLSTEVLKYKIMEELKLIRDNYWATKDGRIYSTKRNRYLKQRVGPRGYMMVNLSIDGRCKTFTVHRREKLGLDKPLSKELMDDLREGVIDLGKKTGDTDAEDVLDNCLIELNRLKDNQSKAIVITYLLGTLPMDLQKFIADQQQKIVIGITAKNLAGEDPEAMLGMLLMGAMLRDEDSDE